MFFKLLILTPAHACMLYLNGKHQYFSRYTCYRLMSLKMHGFTWLVCPRDIVHCIIWVVYVVRVLSFIFFSPGIFCHLCYLRTGTLKEHTSKQANSKNPRTLARMVVTARFAANYWPAHDRFMEKVLRNDLCNGHHDL